MTEQEIIESKNLKQKLSEAPVGEILYWGNLAYKKNETGEFKEIDKKTGEFK